MFLTRKEEAILDGKEGPAKATAMKLLGTIGDIFEAERLVKIHSAQISGISYKNIGDPGLQFIRKFHDMGAKVTIPTTLNPAGMDLKRWKELGFKPDFAEKQIFLAHIFEGMGATPTYTCTPYLVGNRPSLGEHIAWAESSAVAYANSVLGARTNREGGPTSLACSIIGKTPFFGLHTDAGRKPSHIIQVKHRLDRPIEYSALGYSIGRISDLKIPFIETDLQPSVDDLKALAASLAASGAVPMFHIENITPESKKMKNQLSECERIEIEKKDLNETLTELSAEGDSDLVCLGCPHCSLSELRLISKFLRQKEVARDLWVFTSRHKRDVANKKGYVKTIEKAGGKVIADTCMVVSPLEEFVFSGVITNSCKAAHYLPSTCGLKTQVKGLRECVDIAVKQNG